jgi:hypothetical protein
MSAGDMGDDFRAMRATRNQKHADWHRENRAAIEASRIEYIDRDETLLFRLCGIRVDFYPSTGRWREPDHTKTYRGGAKAFLPWLRKAVVERGLFCARNLHRGEPVEMCEPAQSWSLCPLCGAQVCTRCDEPHSTGACDP